MIMFKTKNRRRRKMNDHRALYGTVCLGGGGYGIAFAPEKTEYGFSTSCMDGYGIFPANKYPELPVIRFDLASGDKAMASLRQNMHEVDPQYCVEVDLQLFLVSFWTLGIPVIKTKTPLESD